MEPLDFLDLVTPSKGNRVVAISVPKPEGGAWFKYRACKTNAEAVDLLERLNGRGDTVYFTVNAFGDRYFDETKNKYRIRTQENVVACRSLFNDFDVDPDKNRLARENGRSEPAYDTKKEAFADVVRLATELRLTPTITSSGGGFHCYFTLDEDVDVAVWEELSALKRDIANHLKVRYDPAVDMDAARILRPIGVHNRKYDPPREVTLVKAGRAYSVAHVRDTMQAYIRANDVQPAPTIKGKAKMANPFAAAVEEYPVSHADKVAEHCAAIREFRDSRGNIPEPHWHRAVGVVKFCENGEAVAHEWSSGHPDYSELETQDKIDEWSVGPTTCAQMDLHVGCKADCPFADKVKSPIQLGHAEDAASVEEKTVDENDDTDVAAQASTHGAVIEGQKIPFWPSTGYRWNGGSLSRSIVDEDGVVHWRPFSRSFIYPVNRIQDSEGTWVIHWRALEKNGRWREFFMPTSELASTDMMAKTLAAHEVFLMRARNSRNDMAEFAEGLVEKLQEWRIETKTYKQFGWTEDYSGFVLGTKMITRSGEEEVLCDPAMPPDVSVDFGTSGTLDEWVENINTLYNRPGAEPFQFALCHSMGSLLVSMFGSSNWHGLPLAFTGHGGSGKSTAAKISCGFYGNPKHMERQTGEQGSTLNAAIKRIAIMGSVPLLLDEFSGRSADELTRTGYALANGRDKERLGTNGRFSTVGGEWHKNSFITSNDSIHESISKLPAGFRVEATQLRFFEVQLPKDYRSKIFNDITQEFVEHHMDHVYGTPLRPFVRFIIENNDWVRRQIVAARSRFNPKSEDDNKERFYRDTIVTALVAGKIAERLGLISFDLAAMKKWAVNHVEQMRESRRSTNIDISEQLAQFIATLPGRLIITRKLGDSRATKEVPLEILRAPAVGRVCTEDQRVFITAKAVTDWCKENGVPPSELRDELDRGGYLVFTATGEMTSKMYLGAGTTVPSGQTRCYELRYHKLFDGKSLSLVSTGDGVVAQAQEV